MNKTKTFIYPKELETASNQVKSHYKKWVEISQQLENHPERYYSVIDKYGDEQKIDCAGIYSVNLQKLNRLGVNDKSDIEEVKRRSDIILKIKQDKTRENKKWNNLFNGKSGNRNVLDFKKGDILEAFGKYKNVTDTHKLIKEWGFNIAYSKLEKFYYDNLEEIKDRRARFSASAKDYYLATEVGRIQTLSELFVKLKELFEETDNVKYASEIRAIIEQIRKEVKGDEIKLTVDGKIDLTATIQANRTLLELNQRLSINELIIGLVAGKRGLNAIDIQSQLANSFYSNYNGFSEIKEDEEMKLPSHLINSYDWKEIERVHGDKEKKATQILFEKELAPVWKKNGIKFKGNIQESLRELEAKLNGEAIPEIIDVQPIEVEVVEDKKQDIKSKRDLLKEILENKKQNLK